MLRHTGSSLEAEAHDPEPLASARRVVARIADPPRLLPFPGAQRRELAAQKAASSSTRGR
jgi:hypothetical protein